MIKTKKQQLFHGQMLADCKNILEKNGVTAILTNSALLGAYRDGEMIRHCPGAVLSCFYDEITPAEKNIITDLICAGFIIKKHFINRNYKIKIVKGDLNIEIVGYSFDGEKYYRQLSNKKKIIPKIFFTPPFKKIKLYGIDYKCPADIEGFLSFLYQDWKKIIKKGGTPSNYKSSKHMVKE